MSEEQYHSASHCKYLIQYHIIWCPKFRFSVLNSKGTVLARKFINRQAEKDHLNVMLKRKSLYICGKNP